MIPERQNDESGSKPESSRSAAEVKVVPAKTSILESEIFRADPEQEREMYLRMFVDNYRPEVQA